MRNPTKGGSLVAAGILASLARMTQALGVSLKEVGISDSA